MHLSPQYECSGRERQPPPWSDELAQMSRHIYTRHGTNDGAAKAVFQVKEDRLYGALRGGGPVSGVDRFGNTAF